VKERGENGTDTGSHRLSQRERERERDREKRGLRLKREKMSDFLENLEFCPKNLENSNFIQII